MTENVTLENVYNLSSDENTYDNAIWGSIDPRSGEINIYPHDVSLEIEESYQKYKINDNENFINIVNYHDITIKFKKYDRFIQTTIGGLRSVFREENIQGDEITIMKSVYYDQKYKAWYLQEDKITHLGFLVDTSGSMFKLYNKIVEKGIEEFLQKQKKDCPNKICFYGVTFSDTIVSLYKGEDLRKITDLEDKFYNIKPCGMTAYYDAFIKIIDHIDDNYQRGDEVIICSMTDGDDNSSINRMETLRSMIKNRKNSGWTIIMFGTDDLDLDTTCSNIGIDYNNTLRIGKDDINCQNAYRSVSAGIQRMRENQDGVFGFTDNERSVSYQ